VSLELRTYQFNELRVTRGETGNQVEGYASVYDQWSDDLGGFVERVVGGAFDSILATDPDTRALQNHDPNRVLGRTSSNTLRMFADSNGLHVDITPPNTTYANDLLVVMERGDVDQMSFAFLAEQDEWRMNDNGVIERDLLSFKTLGDVSVVTFPAYPQTSVQIRSLTTTYQRLRHADRTDEAAMVHTLLTDLRQRQAVLLSPDSDQWQVQLAHKRLRLQLLTL